VPSIPTYAARREVRPVRIGGDKNDRLSVDDDEYPTRALDDESRARDVLLAAVKLSPPADW